ncbi:MAG: type II toxin-antitoxin system YafQ family toxin [Burkholderiales bacterium]|nr:type II toxin-antitoxin system YafQ family toxin [Burkholderiales bacterium]
MLKIKQSNAFKRDVKKSRAQGKKFESFEEIIKLLLSGGELPVSYRNHKLSGNYEGYSELHIKPDWLLIYKITDNILYLARMGSYSELF